MSEAVTAILTPGLSSKGRGANREAEALGRLGAECRAAGVAREVLLVRLSLIPARDFRPHYARLAESALERLGRADRARLYRLPGHDLALAWRGEAASLERASTAALRMLLSAAAAPLPPLDALLCRFSLPADAGRLAALLPEAANTAAATGPSAPKRAGLDLAELALIERALASADVSRFARRRVVGRRTEGGFRFAFERRFLLLAEIGASLAPERDLTADPWLLRRLERTLDRRMLAFLAVPGGLACRAPFSVALATASILSRAFLAFDAALPSGLRGGLLLELDPADILADPSAFAFARDFVRGRGYRLILRAPPTLALLSALPLASLGLDFLALDFSTSLAALSREEASRILPEPAKIILRRADDGRAGARALAWGEAAGVTLFERDCVASG